MSVTVADCLKRPSLREAQLMGGEKGLNRIVTSVTVIEYPEVPALTNEVVVGNELIVSALVIIKDDVESQCRLLRHLHSMGSACLVIFYVGVFVPQIDPRLIALADEIHFPLISMPYGRMDFRYCDVITDVMELVLSHQKMETYYVSTVMNQVSLLLPQHRTVTAVLRLLSDRLRCSLILTDRYLKRRGAAPWPHSNQWDYQQLLTMIQNSKMPINEPSEEVIDGKSFRIWHLTVEAKKYHGLRLFALDEQSHLNFSMLQQAADVIATFLNIWDAGAYDEGTDALVQAVLSDNPAEMIRLASRLDIHIESVHTMWLLKVTMPDGSKPDAGKELDIIFQLRTLLVEHYRLTIIDSYEDYIVVFSDDLSFNETALELGEEFAQRLELAGLRVRGAIFEGLDSTAQARDAYIRVCENFDTLCRIYPVRSMITESELRFAQSCGEILKGGEERVKNCLRPLQKLQPLSDNAELIETLCTYLLDADSSSTQTGVLLFMHKNTVNYRLSKIKDILKCDLAQLPDAFDIYQCAALYRLLK